MEGKRERGREREERERREKREERLGKELGGQSAFLEGGVERKRDREREERQREIERERERARKTGRETWKNQICVLWRFQVTEFLSQTLPGHSRKWEV